MDSFSYTRIMLYAVVFFFGFLWSYLFLRQFLYNLLIAFPLIKKMNRLQMDLIAPGAFRYTMVSCFVCFFLAAILLFLVIYFMALDLIIFFAIGAVMATILYLIRMRPTNRQMFDLFVDAYYRFIPDDELRTLLYKKEYKKIKPRLKQMGISDTFLPNFK